VPNDLIVRILGDASGFERTLKASTATATGFERTLKKTAVTAEESARAQVAASVRKDERLRSEIATYRAVAAAAEKGSQEQIVAANLADRAQARLARSMGVTAAESRRLSASTRTVERDLSHATPRHRFRLRDLPKPRPLGCVRVRWLPRVRWRVGVPADVDRRRPRRPGSQPAARAAAREQRQVVRATTANRSTAPPTARGAGRDRERRVEGRFDDDSANDAERREGVA
jgi:hypothetical protein